MAVNLAKNDARISLPGYVPFIDALQAVYDLQDINPSQIKWANISAGLIGLSSESLTYPPSIVASIADDHPQMSVLLYPQNGGKMVTTAPYYAPILLRDVQRWGQFREGLGNYQVNGWKGVTEAEEMFRQPRSLVEIINTQDSLKNSINGTTPIVEAIVLVPIAPEGEFETEFAPRIMLGLTGHRHYKVNVIAGDRLSAYTVLSNGGPTDIKDIDAEKQTYNWKANFIPDMSTIDQLFLPDSAGHMIIIATPYDAPKPKMLPIDDFDFGGRDYLGGGGMKSYGGTFSLGLPQRKLFAGGIDIGRGSRTGQGSLYDGKLENSNRGNSAIYHLRFVGIKPDQTKTASAEMIDALEKTIDAYKTQ